MDQEILVPTPESIEFSHEPAGIGSRFVASVVDSLLQAVMIMGAALIAGVWSLPLRSITSSIDPWAAAVMVIMIFLIFWGYYIFFEMVWNGQTPGKRAAGIRVLKEGGYPVGFLDSVVRNLLRPIDFLPFFYGVGAIVVFCNSRCKRIGDFAAGTIVVKEQQIEMPHSLRASYVPIHKDAAIEGQKLTNLYKLSQTELEIVRQFITRRHSIQQSARSSLARKIAKPLIKKLELRPELIAGHEEEFLEKIAADYRKLTERGETTRYTL